MEQHPAAASSSRKRARSEEECSTASSLDNLHTADSHDDHTSAGSSARKSLLHQLRHERACVLEHRLHLEAQLADLRSFQDGAGSSGIGADGDGTASFLDDLQVSIQASLQQDQLLAHRLAELEQAAHAPGPSPSHQPQLQPLDLQPLDTAAPRPLLEDGLAALDIDAQRAHLLRRKRRRLETRQRVVHWLEAACTSPPIDPAPVEPAR